MTEIFLDFGGGVEYIACTLPVTYRTEALVIKALSIVSQ